MASSVTLAAEAVPTPVVARMPAPAPAMVARDWRSLDRPDQIVRWDALSQWTREPNPFHESWFLLPALRTFDPQGRVKLLCLEAEGQFVGLLPLKRESDYYGHRLPHWRGWFHPNAFLGIPLVAPGFEAAFWRALLAWCDRNAGVGLFLHLAQMPAEGPLQAALAEVLRQSPRPAATVARGERAILRSDLSPEAYLDQAMSAKKRKELRRQHRRLAETGDLQTHRSATDEGLAAWIDEFLALESAGWKGGAGSALASDPSTEALFRGSLEGAARRGRLERLTVRLDGRPVAMLASFVCAPGLFSFKTTFDEAYASYSPGVLLQQENLRVLEREDIAWCDSCATAGHPMIERIWREKRAIAAHSIGIGGWARRALFSRLAAWETGRPAKGLE